MTKAPTTLTMLDASTGHISPSTREWMSDADNQEKYGFMARAHGFAVSTHLGRDGHWEDKLDIPRDLLHVLRYAHANDMDWVLLDADADLDPNLPWYEDRNTAPDLPDHLGELLLDQTGDGRAPAIDPVLVSLASLRVKTDRTLEDETYKIPDFEGAWLSVGGLAVRLKHQTWGVQITSFVDGFEMEEPMSETRHIRTDIDEERDRLQAELDADGPEL